jgi:hypothetical protein
MVLTLQMVDVVLDELLVTESGLDGMLVTESGLVHLLGSLLV